MNCKPGDLAVIVFSPAGNEGKIVTCLEYVGLFPWRQGAKPTWRVDRHLPRDTFPELGNLLADMQLRPIRDPGDDAQDESLSWKKVPSTDKREELA